jgi:hypothetical protein
VENSENALGAGVGAAEGEDKDADEEEQSREKEDQDAAVNGTGVRGVAGGFVTEGAGLGESRRKS